ncbi:hypothetical protein [Endozoicomonas ascidiicola]|uniref:hypothetical protein n=1 Tax=Endozoicomonas ascidiicola TaxID=1698521 RepID=UPI0008304AC4|nr:hypothetical protein [Endozoicomonas ascidiicola]
MEDSNFKCDGCKELIKGTEEKPANAWHSRDLTLCDTCHDSRCGECGAVTSQMEPENIVYEDDVFYCADCAL